MGTNMFMKHNIKKITPNGPWSTGTRLNYSFPELKYCHLLTFVIGGQNEVFVKFPQKDLDKSKPLDRKFSFSLSLNNRFINFLQLLQLCIRMSNFINSVKQMVVTSCW